jgi:hypothetical protein
MLAMTEIIAYRNPLEAWMWQSGIPAYLAVFLMLLGVSFSIFDSWKITKKYSDKLSVLFSIIGTIAVFLYVKGYW